MELFPAAVGGSLCTMNFRWPHEPLRFEPPTRGGLLLLVCLAAVVWAQTGVAQTTSNAAPRLALTPLTAQASLLAWPATAAACDLEETGDLGLAAHWNRIARLPSLCSNTLSLMLTNAKPRAFYRLRGGTTATVQVIRTPANSLVPDAVVDNKGTLHLVYGCSGIEAVKRVKEKRSGALFNKRFVEFLEKIPAKV